MVDERSEERTTFDYAVTPVEVYVTRDPTNPSFARLDVGVSNRTGRAVECGWIVVEIAIDGSGSALTADPAVVTVNSSRPGEWEISPIDGDPGKFRAVPVPPNVGLGAGGSVSFRLSNIVVNEEPGLTKLRVIELTDARGETSLDVNKVRSSVEIERFVAVPATVSPGGSSLLSWRTRDSAMVTLAWDDQCEPVEPKDSRQVEPRDSTMYTLTAQGQTGPDVSATQWVVVNRVEIVSFDGPPGAVLQGGEAKLSWRTRNAVRCELWQGGVPLDREAPSETSDYPVRPRKDPTVYWLYAYDGAGNRTSASIAVYLFRMKLALTGRLQVTPAPGGVTGLVASPDGRRLYVVGSIGRSGLVPNTLFVIDLDERAIVDQFDIGMSWGSAAISADGALIYVTQREQNRLRVIDVAARAVVDHIPVGGPSGIVRLSLDGRKIFALSTSPARLSILDSANPGARADVAVGGGARDVAVSNDTSRVYVSSASDNAVSVVDVREARQVHSVPIVSFPWGVAALQDGSRVYAVGSSNNVVSIIDTTKPDYPVTVGPTLGGHLTEAGVPPDGSGVCYVMSNVPPKLFGLDGATGEVLSSLDLPGSRLWSLATGRYGRTLYVSDDLARSVSFVTADEDPVAPEARGSEEM